jgi:hypothetical protein
MSAAPAPYEIDDDPSRLDVDAIWAFLSTQAYWGRWRSRDDFLRQLESSWRVVGAYDGATQVGFARVLSDGVALAYLADAHDIYRRFGFSEPDATMMERPSRR